MVPYCGQTFRVRTRVERFIDEKTGKMRRLKTPAVILDNVFCRSRYSYHRMYCPRSIFAWWREIWLERVADNGEQKIVGDVVECPAMALMREAAEGRLVTPALSARTRVEKESPVEPANVERKRA